MGKRRERVKQAFHDKEHKDRGHYSKRVAGVVLSLISVAAVALTVIGVLFLKREFNETNTDVLRAWADEHPLLGALLILVICALQVVVAFVPGEMVEIACGYIFGAVFGTILCLAGILLGSVCAMLLARRFGRKLVESFYPREKLESLPILNDPSKRNLATAILFLIPGTPKDLMTYIIGMTDMSIPLYLLLTGLCRLPSVLISTVGGDALGNNRWVQTIVFFALSAVFSLIGYFVYQIVQKRMFAQKQHQNESETDKLS
ncbi:MAG: TVP38/TMEM64 family protein [Clostridia bacterium]|nr:TVP38/TMEM64 family protein [Clostridia bacterium]